MLLESGHVGQVDIFIVYSSNEGLRLLKIVSRSLRLFKRSSNPLNAICISRKAISLARPFL